MNDVFLGKAWHWALIIGASGLLWWCGSERLHVSEFSVFVSLLWAGTAIAVLAVLALHTPGERVTRDELVETPAPEVPGPRED